MTEHKSLKTLRLERGLSRWQLARKCRVSEATIANTERVISAPTPRTRGKLAKALGIPEDELPVKPWRPSSRPAPRPVDAHWLQEHYVDKGWRIQDIADYVGKSKGYARQLLIDAGIPRRPPHGREKANGTPTADG